MKRLLFHAWLCAAFLSATGLKADDAAVEQQLNDVYTQLRHTLTPAEKESLKQEEVQWLNQRDRFSRDDPRRTAMTEERIRVLQSRLSGGTRPPQTGDATPPPQTSGASTSPDGQYALTALASAGGGQGDDIDLMTTDGKLVLSVASAAQYGFKAYWSEDSRHLVVLVPGRSGGRMRDTMFLVQKVSEDWKTLDYGLPGSAEKVTFLSWSSARTARLRSDGAEVTMTFPEPTKFVFRVGRFADITLETRQGEERITYESGDKQGSETLLDSPVTLIAPLTWETRKGTRFQLKKLDHPVINDANRKINSGDWKLTVSGNGDEYNSLKQNLGETARIEYYGEIALEAIGK
jgi:hypothetical protein